MKLDRFAIGLAAMGMLALTSGCSSTTARATAPLRTASAAPLSAEEASIAGTTNLMSAKLAGPAPKVGKAHLAVDDASDDIESGSTSGPSDLDAPKEARRSDGSRRGGSFGSSK